MLCHPTRRSLNESAAKLASRLADSANAASARSLRAKSGEQSVLHLGNFDPGVLASNSMEPSWGQPVPHFGAPRKRVSPAPGEAHGWEPWINSSGLIFLASFLAQSINQRHSRPSLPFLEHPIDRRWSALATVVTKLPGLGNSPVTLWRKIATASLVRSAIVAVAPSSGPPQHTRRQQALRASLGHDHFTMKWQRSN